VTELEIRRRYASGGASIFGLGIPISRALDELKASSGGQVHRMLRELIDRSLGAAGPAF